ncbi:MAG TPA: thioesterase family protein [Solirubrobacteraceae bacterium]|nr:thioesterase family protein [Solirubrobacteraceae bacterium]
MTEAIFERRGEAFWATDLARGPWDPNAQHGGAPAALLGRELERLDPQPELRIVRITYELLRPVPLGELHVHAEITRQGKRVQLLEAALSAPDGTVLVLARAVRVVRAPVTAGSVSEATPPAPESAQTAVTPWHPRSLPGGAVEFRYVQGDPSELGPRTAWFRLKVPVIAGEEPTPLQRLLVAADFPNGISNEIDWREWLFVNPDLTVYIEREPRGEWIGLQAHTRMLDGEAALAQAVLFDTEGRIGRSLQSLYVARR